MELIKMIDRLEPKFNELSASHKAVKFAQECLFAKQLLLGNGYLKQMAEQNPATLEASILNIASIGLSLNPALKQAYLVPMDGRVNLMPSYVGLCHLAQETGSVRYVQAEIVCKGDNFKLNGVGNKPTHEFDPFSTEREEIIGAYCVAKTSDGDFLTTSMPIKDIYAARDRSKAWGAWLSKKKSCPWVTDEKEMIKKTVIKLASKMWPKSERTYRLDEAIQADNEINGIDFELEKLEAIEARKEQSKKEKEEYLENVKKKEVKIDRIKLSLGQITQGMDVKDKGQTMITLCDVRSFTDLSKKTLEQLDQIIEKINTFQDQKQKRSGDLKPTTEEIPWD